MGMEAPDSTGGHGLCHLFTLVHEVSEVGELIQVSPGPDAHLLAGFRGRVNNNVLLLACLRTWDGDAFLLGLDQSACAITIMLPYEGNNLTLADLQLLSSHMDNLCPEGAALLESAGGW